jgi:hypothetical protein
LSSMVAAHTSTRSTYSTRGSITGPLPLNYCELSAILCSDANTRSLRLILRCRSSDVAMRIACYDLRNILLLCRKLFHDINQYQGPKFSSAGRPWIKARVRLRGRSE